MLLIRNSPVPGVNSTRATEDFRRPVPFTGFKIMIH